MATINDNIFDAITRRQLRVMRYSSSLSQSAVAALRGHDDELRATVTDHFVRLGGRAIGHDSTQTNLGALDKKIAKIRSTAWFDSRSVVNTELDDFLRDELNYLNALYQSTTPLQTKVVKPNLADAIKTVKQTPIAEGITTSVYFEQAQRRDIERIQSRARLAVVNETDPAKRVAMITGTANQSFKNGALNAAWQSVDNLTRTSVNRVVDVATSETVAANQTILQRIVFTATLDARTTPVCMAHDGNHYKHNEGPMPPLHFRCRSRRIAVYDWDNFNTERPFNPMLEKKTLAEYTKANGLDGYRTSNGLPIKSRADLPHGTRGDYDKYKRATYRKLVGQTPAKTVYNDWLKRQSNEFQEEVLGKSRAKIWRESSEHLDKFIDTQGNWLTLDALRAKGI